jgi:hypothetical protein
MYFVIDYKYSEKSHMIVDGDYIACPLESFDSPSMLLGLGIDPLTLSPILASALHRSSSSQYARLIQHLPLSK